MKIGNKIGISRSYKDNGDFSGGFYPVSISCINTGVWIGKRKWYSSQPFNFYPQNISCFSFGIWIMPKEWIGETKWKFNR